LTGPVVARAVLDCDRWLAADPDASQTKTKTLRLRLLEAPELLPGQYFRVRLFDEHPELHL
jgi:hypothetical protein